MRYQKSVKLVVLDFNGVFLGDDARDNSFTRLFDYISKLEGIHPFKRFGAKWFEKTIKFAAKNAPELRPNLPAFILSEWFLKGSSKQDLYHSLDSRKILYKNLNNLSVLKTKLDEIYSTSDVNFVCITYEPKQIVEELFKREGINYVDVLAPEFEFENGVVRGLNYHDFRKTKKELSEKYIEVLREGGRDAEIILSVGDRKQDRVCERHIDVTIAPLSFESAYSTADLQNNIN